eukprot:gnl/MRDRNA2_/MRDRNA2_59562_c0_seq1.p1 gnl/MRDRNA2_/MRDRNA2_59562_c0~~gnl/MRDRNA2_/MRDRNA2_59562_c0_seq1.p1  ORF type:complete len:197 (+),score=15.77 gnl/MRDRNA2_/MRDRNA2_59562_c0_seq1:571-1161(+)
MTFDVERIAHLMRGRPLVTTVVREPYETCRSGYLYQRIDIDVNQYMTSPRLRDVTAQQIAGEHHHNWVYQAYTADPDCKQMMTHFRLYDLAAPYERYTEFLVELHRRLPRAWRVNQSELCSKRTNAIATRSDVTRSARKKFDETFTETSHAKWSKVFTCQRMAYDNAISHWQDVRGRNIQSDVDKFQHVCALDAKS